MLLFMYVLNFIQFENVKSKYAKVDSNNSFDINLQLKVF